MSCFAKSYHFVFMSLPYNLKRFDASHKTCILSLDLKIPFCKLADKVRPYLQRRKEKDNGRHKRHLP
nr:MAG TPA: hypothetical protein [Caudoviricetes sp.]